MDVILKVLEGAKTGATIAVKKSNFIIGRSQSCHLCAGSNAISRQHCEILRDENRVTIKDLSSRNGTWVNGKKVEGELELATGDEVIVGPLKLLVAITPGINNAKKPEVKTVAEAVARTAEPRRAGPIGDDDISQWLLGTPSALTETQTIRIDDTNAIQQMVDAAELSEQRAANAEAETVAAPGAAREEAKAAGKSNPGKLPKLANKSNAKDSREAAVEALRAWSRRR